MEPDDDEWDAVTHRAHALADQAAPLARRMQELSSQASSSQPSSASQDTPRSRRAAHSHSPAPRRDLSIIGLGTRRGAVVLDPRPASLSPDYGLAAPAPAPAPPPAPAPAPRRRDRAWANDGKRKKRLRPAGGGAGAGAGIDRPAHWGDAAPARRPSPRRPGPPRPARRLPPPRPASNEDSAQALFGAFEAAAVARAQPAEPQPDIDEVPDAEMSSLQQSPPRRSPARNNSGRNSSGRNSSGRARPSAVRALQAAFPNLNRAHMACTAEESKLDFYLGQGEAPRPGNVDDPRLRESATLTVVAVEGVDAAHLRAVCYVHLSSSSSLRPGAFVLGLWRPGSRQAARLRPGVSVRAYRPWRVLPGDPLPVLVGAQLLEFLAEPLAAPPAPAPARARPPRPPYELAPPDTQHSQQTTEEEDDEDPELAAAAASALSQQERDLTTGELLGVAQRVFSCTGLRLGGDQGPEAHVLVQTAAANPVVVAVDNALLEEWLPLLSVLEGSVCRFAGLRRGPRAWADVDAEAMGCAPAEMLVRQTSRLLLLRAERGAGARLQVEPQARPPAEYAPPAAEAAVLARAVGYGSGVLALARAGGRADALRVRGAAAEAAARRAVRAAAVVLVRDARRGADGLLAGGDLWRVERAEGGEPPGPLPSLLRCGPLLTPGGGGAWRAVDMAVAVAGYSGLDLPAAASPVLSSSGSALALGAVARVRGVVEAAEAAGGAGQLPSRRACPHCDRTVVTLPGGNKKAAAFCDGCGVRVKPVNVFHVRLRVAGGVGVLLDHDRAKRLLRDELHAAAAAGAGGREVIQRAVAALVGREVDVVGVVSSGGPCGGGSGSVEVSAGPVVV